MLSTVFLERVPARMRARAGGVMAAGCWAGMPVGALAAGLMVEHAGVIATLIGIGVAYLLVTLAPFGPGSWRELDRKARKQKARKQKARKQKAGKQKAGKQKARPQTKDQSAVEPVEATTTAPQILPAGSRGRSDPAPGRRSQ